MPESNLMVVKECGPGWDKLIDPIIKLCEDDGAEILQIKEKFGGLRFYVHNPSPIIELEIKEAERLSYKTCEVCGEPGLLYGGSWLKTLCKEHAGKATLTTKLKKEENNG